MALRYFQGAKLPNGRGGEGLVNTFGKNEAIYICLSILIYLVVCVTTDLGSRQLRGGRSVELCQVWMRESDVTRRMWKRALTHTDPSDRTDRRTRAHTRTHTQLHIQLCTKESVQQISVLNDRGIEGNADRFREI